MRSILDFFPEEFSLAVLDVGAAMDEAPAYGSLVQAGRARIIGFEPDAVECARLNRIYGPPHQFLPHFVGDGEEAVFHETNWSMTGSLYEPNSELLNLFQNLGEYVQPVARHPVQTKRLDDMAEIDDVDFFKIDVQGAELSVFRNASRALAGALFVQTEVEFVELYKGQPLFADVDTFLRASGFRFHAFQYVAGRAFKPLIANDDPNAAFRQVLWADAIYARDWMRLEELSFEKLRNYAVLAHDLFASFDLAHLVLSALDRRIGAGLAPTYLRHLADPS